MTNIMLGGEKAEFEAKIEIEVKIYAKSDFFTTLSLVLGSTSMNC